MRSSRTMLVALAIGLLLVGLFVVARDADEAMEDHGASVALETKPAELGVPDGGRGTGAHHGFLYGRVTTPDGATYEGRLRFGGDEEAFWDDYFGGFKAQNRWAEFVPPGLLAETRTFSLFGFDVAELERPIDLRRPFLARFGDIARIDASGSRISITLKSGTVAELDRMSADDFADGIRIWDPTRGTVDLTERQVSSIEFMPAPPLAEAPRRLSGTVQMGASELTGFIRYDGRYAVGSDILVGATAEGSMGIPLSTIEAIEPRADDSVLVTRIDGRTLIVTETHRAAPAGRTVTVTTDRIGRALIALEAVDRIEFDRGKGDGGEAAPAGDRARGSGPAYDDFPPGVPLRGTVTTRAGRELTGRLVYDLDESETTDTLDAPADDVDHSIPFGLVASIERVGGGTDTGNGGSSAADHVRVTLHGGEQLHLEPAGDLADTNLGLLVSEEGRSQPEFVPWTDVARIDFGRPGEVGLRRE